jgi:hypothetical protein
MTNVINLLVITIYKMVNDYKISSKFYNKFENSDECVKIPREFKQKIKEKTNKYKMLRLKDSIHSHKNMRKDGKDWKNFNQYIY